MSLAAAIPSRSSETCYARSERLRFAWVYVGKKSGKRYPTNVLVDSSAHELVTSPMWFHKCAPKVDNQLEDSRLEVQS